LAERLDGSHYRDDILRLFVHLLPSRRLPATQQIALALSHRLRLDGEADRALPSLVSEGRDGAAYHPAPKARVRRPPDVAVRDAGRGRAQLSGCWPSAAMIYPDLQTKAISASGRHRRNPKSPSARKRFRLARLLLRAVSERNPKSWGLMALFAVAARPAAARAFRCGRRNWFCLTIRTAGCGTRTMIAEGLALIDKAMRHRASGPYQIQAARSPHCIAGPEKAGRYRLGKTDRPALWRAWKSWPAVAGGDAQPGGRGLQGCAGAEGGRSRWIEPLAAAALQLFPFLSGVRRRLPDGSSAAMKRRGVAFGPRHPRLPIRRQKPPISACISTA